MIKVSFQSTNSIDDVYEILRNELVGQTDIEDWLIEKVPALEFDCMDFPYDLDSFYDCYFVSKDEVVDASDICAILKYSLENIKNVQFRVCIVDNNLALVKEVCIEESA